MGGECRRERGNEDPSSGIHKRVGRKQSVEKKVVLGKKRRRGRGRRGIQEMVGRDDWAKKGIIRIIILNFFFFAIYADCTYIGLLFSSIFSILSILLCLLVLGTSPARLFRLA
jgi:hypothetical protein